MGDLVSQIFSTLQNIVQGFLGLITSIFSSVVQVFYTAPTGSETTGSLTVVGVLALIALGSSLAIWGFNYIKRLITSARTK